MSGDLTGEDAGNGKYSLPTPDLSAFGEGSTATAVAPPFTPPPGAPPFGPRDRVRFQDPATTRPRPPSVAEQRAQQQFQAAEAAAAEERDDTARRSRAKRRLLRNGAILVAVVLVIGVLAWLQYGQSTTERCVSVSGSSDTVADYQYCDASYVTSHGGYTHDGLLFVPIPGGGYQQYRPYYGGNVSGNTVSGGSYSAPSHGTIKTTGGNTVERGGFGVSGNSVSGNSGGSDSGNSKGKSGSSGSKGKSGGSGGHSGHH
ncbi:MAG TPA: hypothetical protein VF444_22645 [Pseudonocardiaceae bacterium]